MKKYFIFILCLSGKLSAQIENPDEALNTLVEGNERYVQDQLISPRRDAIRRESTVSRQNPFAVILTCSDSRVPPEILFDQGVGDVFVVRVAGNVAGPLETESIEFAVKYLGSVLVMVLGHENCGAVNAVLKGTTKDIESIATLIQPAIKMAQRQKGNRLENAIIDNVESVINKLKNNALLSQYIQEEKLKIVGGYYNLASGKVTLIESKELQPVGLF
jgi:carbonic anhydrase